MDNCLNITLAQVDALLGDLKLNSDKILSVWKDADDHSHMVVFPELSLSGYPPEDLLLRVDFLKACMEQLNSISKASEGFRSLAVLGTPYYDGELYNSLAVIGKGRILGVYHKMFLPNYSVFDEKRYFKRGREGFILSFKGSTIGFSICEDIWHPDGIERSYAVLGADVLVNINASPYYRGKYQFKEAFLKARAEDNLCYLVYVNLVGGQDELVFDGRSLVVDPEGKVIARAKAFEEDALTVSLEIEKVRRKRLTDLRLRESSANYSVNKFSFYDYRKLTCVAPRLEKSPEGEEEVYKALTLGIGSYVRKNNFEKVVLGLSGGIDSSLVACLAVDAVGERRVIGLFMPSSVTSKESCEDVESLTKSLGIELYSVTISNVFESSVGELKKVFGFSDFTVADENIQARIRSNVLFYLSNKYGWLVLSTSNKSETAVGYTTIYGDMAGGFTPLKDVYKTDVYRLAYYRNTIKSDIPERVFKKPPSAELRYGQTDQDVLPPYHTLDSILRLYIEEGVSKESLVEDYGFEKDTVEKVIKMIRSA
ncbi:MAG: NAD+ synthase, partial [Aquificaceae bacterium]